MGCGLGRCADQSHSLCGALWEGHLPDSQQEAADSLRERQNALLGDRACMSVLSGPVASKPLKSAARLFVGGSASSCQAPGIEADGVSAGTVSRAFPSAMSGMWVSVHSTSSSWYPP